jgi:CheY-like chemotaxis protein/DNA-directed RNA polymerase specialized sigma24 family protein
MSNSGPFPDLKADLAAIIPFLRRYARALSGSQVAGDELALATLEAVISAPAQLEDAVSVKVALFRAFHARWASSGAPGVAVPGNTLEARAHRRLSQLGANTREALLLRCVEGFSVEDVAKILGVAKDDAAQLLRTAMSDLAHAVSGDVLIIEDEAIIAMDLETIVSSMGHRVVGVARTSADVQALGARHKPDLILADLQLADKSSGADAVMKLLSILGERPVIFITAYPERLLTGAVAEPTFLITKPYSEDEVRVAVSQALFFAAPHEVDALN